MCRLSERLTSASNRGVAPTPFVIFYGRTTGLRLSCVVVVSRLSGFLHSPLTSQSSDNTVSPAEPPPVLDFDIKHQISVFVWWFAALTTRLNHIAGICVVFFVVTATWTTASSSCKCSNGGSGSGRNTCSHWRYSGHSPRASKFTWQDSRTDQVY